MLQIEMLNEKKCMQKAKKHFTGNRGLSKIISILYFLDRNLTYLIIHIKKIFSHCVCWKTDNTKINKQNPKKLYLLFLLISMM